MQELKDLTIQLDNTTLNIRVAAWIIHNNHILVEKFSESGNLSLIGGRVKIGESSYQALKREVMEEINVQINSAKLYAVVENFFTKQHNNANYHELLYVYIVDMPLPNHLTKEFLWLPLTDIHEIKPNCLIQLAQPSNHIRHIIHVDK